MRKRDQGLFARCDLCGGRASYYRASSGHRLCASCLLRVLEKNIRGLLREHGALRPGSRILVPITCVNTMASLGLAIIAKRMKRGYGSVIHIAVPDFVEIDGAELLSGHIPVKVEPIARLSSLIEKIKYDRVWSAALARSMGLDVVLLPITATDAVLAGLESLFENHESLGEPVESVDIGGVKIISALLSVESSAISALAALSGVSGRCMLGASCDKYYGLLTSLEGPEGEFAPLRALRALRSASASRCGVCGGPARGAVCDVCSRLNLGSLRVEFKR